MFRNSIEFELLNSLPSKARLYQPLIVEEDQIRLVRILPGLESSDVRCRLETVSLKERTARLNKSWLIKSWMQTRLTPALATFQPLKLIGSTQPSKNLHLWGDKSETKGIFVNNQPMRVTANLERALRNFRGTGEFSDHFRLWVDALSINQDDMEERASQVQKMAEIYGHATMALKLVEDLATFQTHSLASELEEMLRHDPKIVGSMKWLGLHELMNRQYWYRLWIVQEIVMGGDRVWLRCGDAVLDWSTFCFGIGVLQEHLWVIKDQCLRNDTHAASILANGGMVAWSTSSLHTVYRDLSRVRSQDSAGDLNHLSFERLLDLACRSDALDARDKVYALIGLMPPPVADLLRPDYSLPRAQVYTRATTAITQALESLDPLREANPWGPTDCPSWVADWLWRGHDHLTRMDAPTWGPRYLFGWKFDNSDHVPYSASGNTKPTVRFLDHGVLECQGFVVDAISGLSARGVEYFSWDHDTVVSPNSFVSVYGSYEATAKAIYRTLLADRDAYGKRSAVRHRALLQLPSTFDLAEPQFLDRGRKWLAGQEVYYFRWELFRRANQDFRLGEDFFHDFFEIEIAPEASEYDVTEAYVCFDRSSKKKRLMTTESGYIGWAPDNIYGGPHEQTQIGDLVVILFGCTTSLVIRPYGERYQVLGEAYVHGMMDGEAMEDFKLGRYKLSTFEFC
ncbi:hypothetical protein EK21DRAFT_103759 [Setomelanomma holmii]|uniref:Heterokaryon incompatibility domain-containing protein n=1 Tax=Setomelanomma holmii TaxID=210430 RepID=A0A9P4H1P8_9PLEO|nr:hypothetical protein EK21DRAFT_103759 [Setomelanomma holmii]